MSEELIRLYEFEAKLNRLLDRVEKLRESIKDTISETVLEEERLEDKERLERNR